MLADRSGDGRLVFTVPDLHRGLFDILLYCAACAESSAGRDLVPVGFLRITGRAPLPNTGSSAASLLAVGALLLALGGLLLLMGNGEGEAAAPPSEP